jgi:predicted nucleic acid-binding Zn ribbon protein
MPTYVYKFVDTGETIEVQQGFQDDTLTEVAHPESGEVKAVKKVFTPVGVTFKGSGFFKTDNRGKKPSTTTSTDSSSKSDSGSSESKSSDTKSSDTKASDTKSSGTPSSSGSTSKSETKSSSTTSSSS